MTDDRRTKTQLIAENAALRESEERFRTVADSAHDWVYLLDDEGRFVYLSPSCEQTTGYSAAEFMADPGLLEEITHPDDRPAIAEHLRTQLCHQGAVRLAFRILTRDKQERWIEHTCQPAYGQDGQCLGRRASNRDVTESRRAEESLRHSEAKYRRLYESMRDAFVSVTMDGRIHEYNRVYQDMLGYDSAELAARTFWDLTPAKWHAFQAEIIERQVRPRGYSDVFQKEYQRKDGTVFPVELRTVLLRDDKGEPCGMWAILRDITDRKQVEAELRKARDELGRRVNERTAELQEANEQLAVFRRFAESSGQGFGMADMDGLITYMNPALCRMAGVAKPEDAVGKHLTTYYPEGYLRKRETEILPALLREGHWEGELVVSAAGETTYVLQNSFLIKDENGNPSRLASVITDITERKRVDAALRQSEEKYRTLVETSPDAVVMTDLKGRVTFASSAALKNYGAERLEDVLGGNPLAFIAEKDHQRFLANLRRTIEQGITRDIEYEFVRKNGTHFACEVSAALIRGDSGQPIAVVAVLRDITERKQAQEALQREHRILEHMLQASDHERQLIAYDIHDGLAQYLTAATMQLDTFDHLRNQYPKEAAEAYHAGLLKVRQSLAEARRLISGVRPPILDESGVAPAIAHLVYEYRGRRGPKIEYHGEAEFGRLAPILENSIYRIIQEGLSNAWKYSRSKKVRVELTQQGGQIRIQIQDWGAGFVPENVADSHYGLEGIRERARLLGGSSRIESEPGKGTLIAVELPVLPGAQ